jgi:hypothetical protein
MPDALLWIFAALLTVAGAGAVGAAVAVLRAKR